MTRRLLILLAAVAGATIAGCAKPKRLDIVPIRHEAVPGAVDAQYFERRIYNSFGTLIAIELLWCPTIPGRDEPCRTTVVWRATRSTLAELDAGAVSPSPTPMTTTTSD